MIAGTTGRQDALEVAELAQLVRDLLEHEPAMRDVWVQGEVSNCFEARSGHWYFSIKDEDATFRCVMWKGKAAQQAELPEEGKTLLLHGDVTLYPRRGDVQLVVDYVEGAGLGAFHQQLEALKRKLLEEGLIDEARRRPLPRYPRRIGVVTSRDAAALRDIRSVIERRWPRTELLLAHAAVQGEASAPQLVAALEAIARAEVDVVLLARGGGSIEDLWSFNDEALARAVAACPVPVVSGVGHETDMTIVDFVADLRAPTPTAAAEAATPDGPALRQDLDLYEAALSRRLAVRLATAEDALGALRRRLVLAGPAPGLAERSAALAERRGRLARAMGHRLERARGRHEGRAEGLAALNPRAVLARGYAHVTRARDGSTVRRVGDAAAGEGLRIALTDGELEAVVAGQASLFDAPAEES